MIRYLERDVRDKNRVLGEAGLGAGAGGGTAFIPTESSREHQRRR